VCEQAGRGNSKPSSELGGEKRTKQENRTGSEDKVSKIFEEKS